MSIMAEESILTPTGHDLVLNPQSGFDVNEKINNTIQSSSAGASYEGETVQEPAPASLSKDECSQAKHNHDYMPDRPTSHQIDEELLHQNRDSVVRDLNYCQFSEGNSDDGDAREAFDRSWSSRQVKKSAPETDKLLRGEDFEGPEGAGSSLEKPRQSLFGGPISEEEEHPHGETSMANTENGQAEDLRHAIGTFPDLGGHEQKQRECSQSERSFNVGFNVPSSDRNLITNRPSPAPSEQSFVIPPDNQPTYDLRQNIERKKAFTYIDTDMSGNFDPSDEAKQKILRMNKAKAAKAAHQKQFQKKKGKGIRKLQPPKENKMKLICKLRFEAFGNVRNHISETQNWPDNWSDIDSECERERQEYREFFRLNTPGLRMQMQIVDPRDEIDDLTGHPAARGCKSCRKNGHECSVVENGRYPCTQCSDGDNLCELIVPATIKGRCKQCVADGVEPCSFENESGQIICDHCVKGEFICEALPPEGYRADRINIDELAYGEDRPYLACTVCRQEKKRCSLKRSDKPPCKHCKKNNIGCTFFDVPEPKPTKKAVGVAGRKPSDRTEGPVPEDAMRSSPYFTAEDLADMEMVDGETSSREATPEIEMEDNDGNRGRLTKILTSFAHPIQFNTATEELSVCDFCYTPVFSFTGEFEREVHVIRWYNGLGYTEVGGGHCEDKGATKMCNVCTANRLQIMVCPNHELECLAEDDSMLDFDSVTNDLLSTEPGSIMMQFELLRWCSLCFSVAKFGCSTVQPSLYGEDGEHDTDVVGCGLRLCGRCESRLKEEFEGDVSAMAEKMDMLSKISMDADGEHLEGRVRADVGFLKQDSLLVNNAKATN